MDVNYLPSQSSPINWGFSHDESPSKSPGTSIPLSLRWNFSKLVILIQDLSLTIRLGSFKYLYSLSKILLWMINKFFPHDTVYPLQKTYVKFPANTARLCINTVQKKLWVFNNINMTVYSKNRNHEKRKNLSARLSTSFWFQQDLENWMCVKQINNLAQSAAPLLISEFQEI